MAERVTCERELLNRCAVTLRVRNICPLLLKEITELLAQPEQEPFFQKTYYADECAYISEDLYEKLNEDTTIPVDEHNLTVGVFEVTINWREE